MGRSLRTRVLDEEEYEAWTAFVEDSPYGSVYATPDYLDALGRATGGRFRVVGVFKGDALVGGVAVYEETDPGGVHVSPRLLLYYNGVVLRERDSHYPSRGTSEHLRVLSGLAAWFENAGYGRVTLKSLPRCGDVRPFQLRGWAVHPTYSYVVPLSDSEATWERIEPNLRRLIRRAREAGVTCTEDDDFGSFYRLHADTMERKGKPMYLSPEPFRSYFETLRERELATLLHARLPDGRAIATEMVLLGRHPVAHTVSAASDDEHQALGANPLLRWHSFRALHERGYAGVDLTDASLNPVTRFKSQLGGNLTVSLEVDAPRTLRYRAWERSARAMGRLRGLAGAAARRVLPSR